jgi:hypothetical protein
MHIFPIVEERGYDLQLSYGHIHLPGLEIAVSEIESHLHTLKLFFH